MSARMRWRVPGRPDGPAATAAMLLWLLATTAWVAWPLWRSADVPTRQDQEDLLGWVLAALLSLLLVLAVALWRDADRRAEALAPVALLGLCSVGARHLLNPSVSGVEVVFVGPLLAGMVLGAPAGVLTGAAAAALSAFTTDTVAAPLPAQLLAWALWGLAGGLLRRVPTVLAWLASLPLAVGLGLVSGAVLNLAGWAQDESATTGAALPGADALTQLGALWAYGAETSVGIDLVRGGSCALVLLVVGLPALRELRAAWAPVPDTTGPEPPEAVVSPAARARREPSNTPARIWATAKNRGES